MKGRGCHGAGGGAQGGGGFKKGLTSTPLVRAKQGAIVDRMHTAETARIQRIIAELFSIGKDAW